MSKVHGKSAVLKLDDLAGALGTASSFLNTQKLQAGADRPTTTTFGQNANRRELLGLLDGKSIPVGGFLVQSGTTKLHGRSAQFLMDQYAVHSYLKSVSIKRSATLDGTNTFGDTWTEKDLIGLADASVSLSDGFFDGAASAFDAIVRAVLQQSGASVFSGAAKGFTLGNLVDMVQIVGTEYGVDMGVDKPVTETAEYASDGLIDTGVCLHTLGAEVAVADFTSVDEIAATAAGGVGHLHVTAINATDVVVVIQHSSDNITFADLITFTAKSAVGSERIELSSTTAVNRYVRASIASGTITSVTFTVAFARRGYTSATLAPVGSHRYWAGLLQAANSTSFQVGPEGSAAGAQRATGECRLSSYEMTLSVESPITFSGELQVTGAITFDTF